jgi:hypothetical protein
MSQHIINVRQMNLLALGIWHILLGTTTRYQPIMTTHHLWNVLMGHVQMVVNQYGCTL